MRFEDIGEAIEVIAYFRAGKLRPLKFRWNHRVYKIERVNGGWKSEEGRDRIHHFSVMSDSTDVFEISFSLENFNWKLDRVCLEG
jgi:hypothetical protein